MKRVRFFIYRVLSYFPFSTKNMSTHFRMNITKNSFLELVFSIHTNKFLIKCTFKKNFFSSFFSFFVPEILPFQTVFFQTTISNFCCSQLLPSCDLSLESSWGVDFKYIYFYGWKSYHFWYTDSYHICVLPKKKCKLTFAWILPKNNSWNSLFLYTPINSLLSVRSKKLFFELFSAVSNVFFPENNNI